MMDQEVPWTPSSVKVTERVLVVSIRDVGQSLDIQVNAMPPINEVALEDGSAVIGEKYQQHIKQMLEDFINEKMNK